MGVVVFWGFGVSWTDSERETESQRGSWLQPGHSYLGFFSIHNPGKLLEFGSRLGFFFGATNSSHDLILWLSLLLFCVFRNFVYEHSFLSEAFCSDLEFHGCKLRGGFLGLRCTGDSEDTSSCFGILLAVWHYRWKYSKSSQVCCVPIL